MNTHSYNVTEETNEQLRKLHHLQQQQQQLHQHHQQQAAASIPVPQPQPQVQSHQQHHHHQQQQSHASNRNIGQTTGQNLEYYYQQAKQSAANSYSNQNNSKNIPQNASNFDSKLGASNGQFDHENMETNAYSSSQNYSSSDKYRLDKTLPATLSDHHPTTGSFRDSRRGSTHSSTYSYNPTLSSDNAYRDSFSLSRNDDYLINNFRPFSNVTTSATNSNIYRQTPTYPQQQQQQQQQTMSGASNSSRIYQQPTASYPNQNTLSQRSTHSLHLNGMAPNSYTPNAANTGSSAYNTTSLHRQREIDTSNSPFMTKINTLKSDDRASNPSSGRQPLGNPRMSNLLNASGYSRSNSIVSINGSNLTYKAATGSKMFDTDYSDSNNSPNNNNNSRYDEPQDSYHSNRRDSNG